MKPEEICVKGSDLQKYSSVESCRPSSKAPFV